ncbi:MAG: response regulator transcription factor [Rhodothermales bacterium]|nr:response regulator transcription factor [Rhodothermales bacterium]
MMETSRQIVIWMVEDDADYRATMSSVLQLSPETSLSRSFGSCEEAFAFVASKEFAEADEPVPDVMLLDVNLPGASGLESITQLKNELPGMAIVMLTIRNETETIFSAFRFGASGYLPKDSPIDEILDAVREASRGGTLMPALVAGEVLSLLREAPEKDYGLSDRETDVLREMTLGKSQQAIADALFVSRHTVNTHIQHIYEKLHVHSGIEAVAKALRERIV